jgi:hypothetical protein
MICADALPRALAVRSIAMGSILGGFTSALQIYRDRLGNARAEEILQMRAEKKAEEDALQRVGMEVDDTTHRARQNIDGPEHPVVDRPVTPGEDFSDLMSGYGAEKPKPQTWGSWVKGFGSGSGN